MIGFSKTGSSNGMPLRGRAKLVLNQEGRFQPAETQTGVYYEEP